MHVLLSFWRCPFWIPKDNILEKKIGQMLRIFMSGKSYIILKLLNEVRQETLGFVTFLQFTVPWGSMWKYDTMLETNWMWLRCEDVNELTVQDQLFYYVKYNKRLCSGSPCLEQVCADTPLVCLSVSVLICHT